MCKYYMYVLRHTDMFIFDMFEFDTLIFQGCVSEWHGADKSLSES